MEISVEVRDALMRVKVVGGGREVEAIGPVSDFANVVGLLAAQLVREGFSFEEICQVLRVVGEKRTGV